MGGAKGTDGAKGAKGAKGAPRDGANGATPHAKGGKGGGKVPAKGGKNHGGKKEGGKKGPAHHDPARPSPHRPRTPPALPYDGKPVCYVTGKGIDDRNCLLGIGLATRRGEVSTPMELLSLEAFDGGARTSRNGRMRFQHFLPLSICAAHHKGLVAHHNLLKDTVEDVLCATGRRRVVEKEKFPVQLSFFAAQLLAYLLREMLGARTKDHLSRAVDCYYAVTLTLERADVGSKGAVGEFAAERAVEPFTLSVERRKPEALPDLGAVVALLPFAGVKWADVAKAVAVQAIARGAFDAAIGYAPEPGPYPELFFAEGRREAESFCAKMWAAGAVRQQLRAVLVFAAVATASDGLSGEAVAERNFCMPDELKDAVWRARGALEDCASWDDFAEAAGFPRTKEDKKRDPRGFRWFRSMLDLAFGEADLPEYRHEALKLFKAEALARQRPLKWENIGKPDEKTGKVSCENRMYDFLPKDLPAEA